MMGSASQLRRKGGGAVRLRCPQKPGERFCNAALAVMLAAFGLGKVLTPYASTYALPAWGYYASALLELVGAVSVFRWPRSLFLPCAVDVASLAAVGVAWFHKGDCG